MKTVVVVLALGLLGALAIDQLGDLTQTRHDAYVRGSRSEVVLHVRTRQPFKSTAESASALWGACAGTIGHRMLPPGIVDAGADTFRVVVTPALGTHARQRLRGCLKDTTLDRVKGNVASITELPLDPQPQGVPLG